MDKVQFHGNVMWLQNVTKYDHSKQGFDIINDPYINRTLHLVYNQRNDITEFVWLLPTCDENEEKFLRYVNENFLNGVIAFKFLDKDKYYASTEDSNISKFMETFSIMDFDDIYNDSDIVISEFPIDFGEHILYLFQNIDNSERSDMMYNILNVYGDSFVCMGCPHETFNKELFDHISEYVLSTKKVDSQTSALRDMLETNNNYKVLLWDYPIEHDKGLFKEAIENEEFIKQFNMILYTNTSNASESLVLETIQILISGADLNHKIALVILDGTDDVDKDVLRAILSHYGSQVGIYDQKTEITHQSALFSLISKDLSKFNPNIEDYIVKV